MISFIIPACNADKTIERCLDGIFSQTYKKYEVIVINDGSKDDTCHILDCYASEHDNLIIKEISNHGHGFARNCGLSLAKQEYVWFIDADDCLSDEKALERVVNALEKNNKPDIHIFSVRETDLEKKERIWNFARKEKLYEGKLAIRKLAIKQQWVWNKPIKRQFLLNTGITFNNFRMFEDVYFMISLYKKAKTIYVSREINYIYVKHGEALTANKKNFIKFPQAILREFFFFITFH